VRHVLSIALGLLLTLVTFVGPWPAARAKRPDLFDSNRIRVLEAAKHATRGKGPFRCAFAKREITPQPGEPLAGYGDRYFQGKSCTGAAHSLWCRALALAAGDEVVCIVGLDLLCLTRDCRDRALAELRKRSSLPQENVLFSATHTHSGPGGYSPEFVAKFFLGPLCETSRQRIVTAIAEAVDEATKPLLEGKGERSAVTFLRADLPDFVRNRLLKADGPVDGDYANLVLDGVRVISYGAHATLRGPENTKADGDYPEELCRSENGRECLFLAGAVGSQAARRQPGASEPGHYAHELETTFRARAAGHAVGLELTRAQDTDLRAFEAEIDLPHPSPRLGSFRVSPWLSGTQVGSQASLRFVRLGPLVIAAAPGDLSGELSLRAKKAVEGEGRFLLPISFSGDYHGYLLPEERASLDGYEPSMMWHGPEGGELVLDALVTGARALFD
jgi:hypothetical protein